MGPAGRTPRLRAGLGQRRHEQRQQKGNNGNDNQEFDEGKSVSLFHNQALYD
jgi:hypothetical protein